MTGRGASPCVRRYFVHHVTTVMTTEMTMTMTTVMTTEMTTEMTMMKEQLQLQLQLQQVSLLVSELVADVNAKSAEQGGIQSQAWVRVLALQYNVKLDLPTHPITIIHSTRQQMLIPD